jgi:DNA-binding transcriptional LysR family regulator
VAFVSKRPPIPGFRQQLAFRDELVLVVPSALRSLADLLATDGPLKILVQRLGCSYTERLLALLTAKSRDYRLLEIGTLEGILRFVEVGVGIAAMPRAFVRSVAGATRKVRLLELPRRLRRLDTLVVAPVGDHAPAVVNAFVSTIAAPT